MDAASTTGSSMDEFGFPCHLSRKGMQRLKIRKFTSENQWAARFPSLDSILQADKQVIGALAVTHGLPAAHRASVWLHHSKLTRKVYGLSEAINYAAACSASASLEVDICRQIELDLPRTFPEQQAFASALAMKHGAFDGSRSSAAVCAAAATNNSSLFVPGAGDIHDCVRRMLRAFCVNHPDVGYLQSMNFVSAFILLVFGRQREEEAYYVFETFIACNLRGYYQPDMAALHADCALITSLLRERQPRLMQWLDKLGLPDVGALFLPRWLLCGFLNCFPSDITVRVWDLLLLEGYNAPLVLAETTLAVFRMVAGDLLACGAGKGGGHMDGSCFAEAIEVLKTVGLRITDSAELLHLSRHPECSLRGIGTGRGGEQQPAEDIHGWRRRVAGWTAPWDPTVSKAAGSSSASAPPPFMFSPPRSTSRPMQPPALGSTGSPAAEEAGADSSSSPSSCAPALSMSMLEPGTGSLTSGTPCMPMSAAHTLSHSRALEGSMVAQGPGSAARAVLLRVSGIGARGSPVAIDSGLERILPALPLPPASSPAPALAAAPHSLLKSLRSPLRSPLALPALLGSPAPAGTGRVGRLVGQQGQGSVRSLLGLRSPHVALTSLASSFALPAPQPLDASAIAEALNSSVAAASTRKRRREGAAISEGLAGVASALAASATATALSLGARLGMSMSMGMGMGGGGAGAGSKATPISTHAAAALPPLGTGREDGPLPAHPTAYSEFDHGQQEEGPESGSAGLIPLTRAASVRALHACSSSTGQGTPQEGGGSVEEGGAGENDEEGEERGSKRVKTSSAPLRPLNGASAAAVCKAGKAVAGGGEGAGGAGQVQLMLMSPIRTGGLPMRRKA